MWQITLLFVLALVALIRDIKKEKKYFSFFLIMLALTISVYILNLVKESDSESRMITETNKVIKRDSIINKMNNNVDSLVTKLKIQEEIISLLNKMKMETHSLSSKTDIIGKKQDTLTLKTNIISEEHSRINSFEIRFWLEVEIDSSKKSGRGRSNLLSGPLKISLEDSNGNLFYFSTYLNEFEYNNTNKKYFLTYNEDGKSKGQKIEKLKEIIKMNFRFRDFLQERNSRKGKFVFTITINSLILFESPVLDIETDRLNSNLESYLTVEKIFQNIESLYNYALNH